MTSDNGSKSSQAGDQSNRGPNCQLGIDEGGGLLLVGSSMGETEVEAEVEAIEWGNRQLLID